MVPARAWPAWLDPDDLSRAALPWVADALSHTRRLRVARTPAEREAIYRFRYKIYAEERNRVNYAGVDAARERVFVPEDEHEGTTHYYFARRGRITASVRYSCWPVGGLPEAFRRQHAIDDLEGLDQLRLCAVSGLTVERRLRGSLTSLFLGVRASRHFVPEHGIDAFVTTCAPGLVPMYQRMGFRDFGAAPRVKDVMLLPMVFLVGDIEHSRRVGAPGYPATILAIRAGTVRRMEPEHPVLRRLIRQERLVTSPLGLREVLARAPANPLQRLSAAAQDWLLSGAVAFDVPAGTRVTTEGVTEHECYLALSGAWEARRGGDTPRRIGPGSIFGARESFAADRRRPESVYAVDGGRLLMIRHSRLRGGFRPSRAAWEAREALVQMLLAPGQDALISHPPTEDAR
ncbi:MAG: hypothetical protein R3A52_33055 [Polyangiales bacterium]